MQRALVECGPCSGGWQEEERQEAPQTQLPSSPTSLSASALPRPLRAGLHQILILEHYGCVQLEPDHLIHLEVEQQNLGGRASKPPSSTRQHGRTPGWGGREMRRGNCPRPGWTSITSSSHLSSPSLASAEACSPCIKSDLASPSSCKAGQLRTVRAFYSPAAATSTAQSSYRRLILSDMPQSGGAGQTRRWAL